MCGVRTQVGSGKSSLLEALLGETLPVQAPGKAAAGPVLRGSVAYCSQVPWIVSGSVRVRSARAQPNFSVWSRAALVLRAPSHLAGGLRSRMHDSAMDGPLPRLYAGLTTEQQR